MRLKLRYGLCVLMVLMFGAFAAGCDGDETKDTNNNDTTDNNTDTSQNQDVGTDDTGVITDTTPQQDTSSNDTNTNDDTNVPTDTGTADTTAPDVPVGPTITVTGGINNSIDGTPMVGASVCVFETGIACATTDDQGAYTLPGVPSASEVLIEVTSNGFVPTLVHITTGTEDTTVFSGLIDSTTAVVGASAYGVTLNLNTQGAIGFLSLDTADNNARVSGVSLSLVPQAGDGPYFVDDNAAPDPNLTETSNTGAGSYFNLDPGMYTVIASHPSLTCEANFAHVEPTGGFKVRIVAGYLSAFSVDCQ